MVTFAGRVRENLFDGFPCKGVLTGVFATDDGYWKDASPHSGVDIAAAPGLPIYAPADGVIHPFERHETFGIWTRIKHHDGTYTAYAHMSDRPQWQWGDSVVEGDIIGYVGSSGKATGPHLHWAMSVDGTFPRYTPDGPLRDPLAYLVGKTPPVEAPAPPEPPQEVALPPEAPKLDEYPDLLQEVRDAAHNAVTSALPLITSDIQHELDRTPKPEPAPLPAPGKGQNATRKGVRDEMVGVVAGIPGWEAISTVVTSDEASSLMDAWNASEGEAYDVRVAMMGTVGSSLAARVGWRYIRDAVLPEAKRILGL